MITPLGVIFFQLRRANMASCSTVKQKHVPSVAPFFRISSTAAPENTKQNDEWSA